MLTKSLKGYAYVVYELIQRRLDIADALAWDREFKKAYAVLDLVLRMYPDDLRVHDAYADVLTDEVYTCGDECECPDEKLRKARRHHYFVLRHSTDAKGDHVFRALAGLADQARVNEKDRYESRLDGIITELYGKQRWNRSELAEFDSPCTKGESVEE